jgi:carboxymethylenebutenolidase
MRTRLFAIAILIVALAGTAAAHDMQAHGGGDTTAAAPAPAPRDPNLPPAEETAKGALETSPRHGEFVDVPREGSTAIRTWVVYPEKKDKAGVVLLIHEIFGASDWMRGVADQVARDGYIAVLPDLLSGMGPNGGGTESFPARDSVVRAIRGLTPDEANTRLDAVRAWAVKLPAANGKIATMGFCWGGARSFAYAVRPGVNGAIVYYGTSPDSVAILNVKAPVLGLYGADDARVNATIEPAKKALAGRKGAYDVHVFEGAGHGFLRQQSGRDGANLKATQKAWPLTLAFLKKQLK